ncbi:S8 family serine peptidase, partial [Sphingomonas endophytica]|uniref:S8 family serine peptidase n=1 Tax=Sphingomonas endophytica TaxID=869719 RepID=UPI000ADEF1C5
TPVPTPAPTSSAADSAEYRASAAPSLANAAFAYDRGITGKGVTIAVIDSGVATGSTQFSGRLSADSTGFTQTVARCATCPVETVAPFPIDDRVGHGSAVAAIALGARDGAGSHGMAPDATLLALKIVAPDLTATGRTVPEGTVPNSFLIPAALRYAVGKNAFVSVLALDGAAEGALADDLHAAMNEVRAADRLVVQALPNSDDGVSTGIAQALVGNDRSNARWFLYAVAVDAKGAPRDGNGDPGALADRMLAAAGNGIAAIDATGATTTVTGNSFAAPAIAGAAALLKQYWPQLGGATIARILLDTATDAGAPGVDPVYGAGLLNVAKAMQAQAPASSFVAAQAVLTRFSSLTLSAPFGAGSGLWDAVGTMTVTDRYGRDFAMRGATGLHRMGSGLRVINLTGVSLSPPLADAPRFGLTGDTIGAWGSVRPMAPAVVRVAPAPGQHLTLAAQVALDDTAGMAGTPLRAVLATPTGLFLSWDGHGWSASVARGDARDGRASIRQVRVTTPVGLGAELGTLHERGRILGLSGGPSIGIAGARSTVATLLAQRRFSGVDLTARATVVRTHVAGGSDLLRFPRPLLATAFGISGAHPLFGGVATLGLSSPLRVDRARPTVLKAVAFDLEHTRSTDAATTIDLKPRVRELDLEFGWSARWGERATIRVGAAHAHAAGHVANAQETAGFVSIAIR